MAAGDHGIEVKGQVVVCPGLNDGAVLDDTLAGVLDRYPELASVAVVPLGMSKFNVEAAMRLHTPEEAAAVVDTVEDWQEVFAAVLGRRMVFAADEYYLMTGRDFPPAEHYEGFDMHEDGIGMARTFQLEFDGLVDRPTGPRSGFFAAVDLPANPAAYTGLRSTPSCGSGASAAQDAAVAPVGITLRPRATAPVGILTGTFGAQVLAPIVGRLGRSDVRIIPVPNDFFGGNTGVTGLMTGEDLTRVLAGEPAGHRYLLPDVCLSDDGRFLDGTTVDDLPRPVEIVPTDGISLRRALETP